MSLPESLPSITCPWCHRTSFNINDIREQYCGYCHQFHEIMALQDRLQQMQAQLSPPQHQWLEEAWGEERYYWERGFFCLAKRLPYCDRGRWQAFLEAEAVDDRTWSRYYFSEENAKEEIALWLAHWQQLKANGYQRPYPEPALGDVCWTMEGEHCIVSLTAITNDIAPGKWLGWVVVHPGSEAAFTVDYPDLFPRCYFSQSIAIGELTAWMVCRKQVLVK